MIHDCDCTLCQETDSRWAYVRLRVSKETDCQRGKHTSELWSTNPKPTESTYRCAACQVWCDRDGKQLARCSRCGAYGAHYCPGTRRGEPATPKPVASGCSLHKRYQGKRQPRLPCEACWRKYIYLHPITP